MCIRDRNDTDLIVNAKINGCVGEVLFDSGAEISLMDERFLERHKKHFKKIPILPVNHKIIKSATGESQMVDRQALITISIQGVEIEITVLIIKKLVYDIILGVDALNKLHATIDFPNKMLKCTVNNSRHNIRLGRRRGKTGSVCEPSTLARPAVQLADKITHNLLTHSRQITSSEQDKLQRVLDKFGSVFSNKPTTTNVYEHNIQVTDENKFVRKTYPIPLHYQQQVDAEVKNMLENGVIERTDSNFLNHMVCLLYTSRCV